MKIQRPTVEARQTEKLRSLLNAVIQSNSFYQSRLKGIPAVDQINATNLHLHLPFTTKAEISEDQVRNPPFGTNLTRPLDQYTRFHQTSGSTGKPIRWLDTEEDWQCMLESWKMVFHASGVVAGDRVFFAFSFGPFLGFWTAFEAAHQLQVLCIPGGGLNSSTRLKAIFDNQATVLCCTPTYAIHLGSVAAESGLDMGRCPIRHIIVAGEPGGSVKAIRERIESLWTGAVVHDHHGMTEVGPVTYPCPERPNTLRIHEENYIAEIIDPHTLTPLQHGETGELVLTTIARTGSPLIRYRTGDLVRAVPGNDFHTRHLGLDGGILGRADDMVIVRGVNIFPSAVEAVLRGFPEIDEFQVAVDESKPMTEISVTVEISPGSGDTDESLRQRIETALRDYFNLRIPVSLAEPESLPRFEMKSRRWRKILPSE